VEGSLEDSTKLDCFLGRRKKEASYNYMWRSIRKSIYKYVCEEDGDDKKKKKKIMKGSNPHDFVMISTWTQV
jgi:hypothetical protein